MNLSARKRTLINILSDQGGVILVEGRSKEQLSQEQSTPSLIYTY